MNFLPGVVENLHVICRREQDRSFRQVVEQRRGRIKEQRQIIFDATVRNAVGNFPVHTRPRWLAFEALAIAFAESFYTFSVERYLPGRQNIDIVNSFSRQLAFRIEKPQ